MNLENGMTTLNSDKNNLIENENKKEAINDMNPLDLMNQVITTNSNMSNDTQEQLLNNFNNTNIFNNTNNFNSLNNNIRADSDLLEYSKSCATNQTNFNINSEENTLKIRNYSNNINNSNKKNEFYKRISYHCGKSINKNNINLNNKFSNSENEEENINDDDSENESQINSIKYKNINNHNKNILSTYDNSKYSSLFENNNSRNKNNSINSNSQYQLYSILNNNEDSITKNEYTPYTNKSNLNNTNSNSPKEISLNNTNYNNTNNSNSKNNTTINKGHITGNSSINITNDTSTLKKNTKKLIILSDLENNKNNNKYFLNNTFNSKNNTIQPITTTITNLEMLTYNNEHDIPLGSPQNIPNDLSSKLHDWLISCDLLCYYNLLIKNKIYNIEEYINKIKNKKLVITYKNIEDLGIKKPGHIFRFLLKLKLDSGLIDSYLYNVILDKYSRNSLNEIKINSSNNGIDCCCFRNNNYKIDKISINSGYHNENSYGDSGNDIFYFLKKMELMKLKENFIHNGFDQVEYIMLQMFSEFKFTKEILNEHLHIYNDMDKNKVLKKLYLEKKNICNEYNIDYDINEENEIMLSKPNEINDEIPEANDTCSIF